MTGDPQASTVDETVRHEHKRITARIAELRAEREAINAELRPLVAERDVLARLVGVLDRAKADG